MTSYLYLVPIPEAQTTDPPSERARSNVSAAGLIQDSGFASERIALDSVDLSITGQYRAGEFSKKLARELRSLSQSDYESIPLADNANLDGDDQKAYYHIQTRAVSRAHEATDLAYRYQIGLQVKGTRKDHWRAVSTKSESISTGLATGSSGLIGIPAEATNTRWRDPTAANTPKRASVDSTVDAEFGDVDLFDPSVPAFDNPTLIYSLAFDREGPVDVRVWDDVGSPSSKYVTYDSTDITQWVHAYHPGFDFEGDPIVDNGLIRVRYDSTNQQIDADEWDDANTTWADLATVGGSSADYELYDTDVTDYGPAECQVYAEWQDTGDDTIHPTMLEVQRGENRVVVRQPLNGTIPSDLETMLSPIASDQTTDENPEQTVINRAEVK